MRTRRKPSRRTFTLQLYDVATTCLEPRMCGQVCHCGEDMNGLHDGHSPVPMMCVVCQPLITCSTCGHVDSPNYMHQHECKAEARVG